MEMTIKLSIQEIIYDFEQLIRYDEKLGAYFDFNKASESDISDFSKKVEEIGRKYLPNTVDEILDEAGDDEYDRALTLYKTLHDNFVDIITKLV